MAAYLVTHVDGARWLVDAVSQDAARTAVTAELYKVRTITRATEVMSLQADGVKMIRPTKTPIEGGEGGES
jgi:hypothetical protein